MVAVADVREATFEDLCHALERHIDRFRSLASNGNGHEVYQLGDVVLDATRHEVSVAGRPVYLRRGCFDVLRCLLANAGQVVTYDTLVSRCWGVDGASLECLAAAMATIRRAIGDTDRTMIVNVRGIGYRCG